MTWRVLPRRPIDTSSVKKETRHKIANRVKLAGYEMRFTLSRKFRIRSNTAVERINLS